MNTYNFRGAMAVIAAINSHVIFAMIGMHPIEWHYKVIEIPVEDAKPCKTFHFLLKPHKNKK